MSCIKRALRKIAVFFVDTAGEMRRGLREISNKHTVYCAKSRWAGSTIVSAAAAGEDPTASGDMTPAVDLFYKHEELHSCAALQDWLEWWCGTRHRVVRILYYKKTASGEYELREALLDLEDDVELNTMQDTGGDVSLGSIPSSPVVVGTATSRGYELL